MTREASPTDPDYEQSQGRVALWLDPDDIRWLVRYLGRQEGNAEANERLGRIRFRALAALHKAGLPNDPWQSGESA